MEPARAWEIDKGRALAMAPCIDLDVYFYVKVLQGPVHHPSEMAFGEFLSTLPAFSRQLAACGPALVNAMMEYGPLSMDLRPEYFNEASAKGFVIRNKPCPMWKITASNGKAGYGRNMPEALVKLLILVKVKT